MRDANFRVFAKTIVRVLYTSGAARYRGVGSAMYKVLLPLAMLETLRLFQRNHLQ